MSFVKSKEEMVFYDVPQVEFYGAEMLTVYFETKPEIVARLLPAPLRPAILPVGAAFVANYPKTNFGVSYLESALCLLADYNGEQGIYILSMPVTNDMALILGREVFGYPKKIANIALNKNGDLIEGWTERHGTRFFEVTAKMTGKFNDEGVQQLLLETLKDESDTIVYNFKFFQAPERKGFDYNPRLMREIVRFRRESMKLGEAQMVFRSSKHDYWGDVEIVRVLGAVYSVGNNTMLPGKIVAEADPEAFAPFGFMKLDAMRPD
ncbi:MAG: acetoacetate decarboxylase family protein [Thermodesulfobacteriota bacterium]|jgi:acetoacetate decarboxylase